MSWDVVLQRLPPSARSISDIPDDFEPPVLGKPQSTCGLGGTREQGSMRTAKRRSMEVKMLPLRCPTTVAPRVSETWMLERVRTWNL